MALFGKKEDKKEEKQEAKASEVATAAVSEFSLSLPALLVQPRVSEKAGQLARLNKYAFVVKNNANKVEVKKAVELKYKVKVTQVNMINTQGKTKNFGRTMGRTSDFRKAIVTLRKGESIKGLTDVA
ncbi:MAG: 50S ribosomal protein L23 [Candidatus Doudnabacteria bacterium]|nr:50S ribosomal protein L23 [Candidatus Doudnabacteria bacterium]